ncbi:MAG: ectoine hydroxylase-related dioxygenase (phytanoyl-CoA dioxygenase family) [Gammaproteobacteria bacterium]|jgi:ectoine hydroxylase-related dioxygenase (phytanoyl-CoA dioxygenase family)
MNGLNEEQRESFWSDGYLVVENAVDSELLKAMQDGFSGWVEESRSYKKPYGKTIDGRARFDLETGHSANKPALRRISAPVEISQPYYDAMASSRMTDCVADLIGPNVKFHHAKINSKLPGAQTAVKWHQDFPFTPHSNDDLVTALLMLDDVTQDNGPLEAVSRSHTDKLHGLWHDGVFTGSVADSVAKDCQKKAITCIGPAGSVCLMHTRLLHGSAPNLSDQPRTLFICVYSAEDAIPYSSNPVPSKFEGLLVRGERTNKVRSTPYEMELPQKPKSASFFDQQTRSLEA